MPPAALQGGTYGVRYMTAKCNNILSLRHRTESQEIPPESLWTMTAGPKRQEGRLWKIRHYWPPSHALTGLIGILPSGMKDL